MRRAAASFLQFAALTLIVVVSAAFVITFAAMAVVVQGSSMEPALHNGERVLVNKLVYRLRPPHRGEIVVFRHMAGRMLIKRVTGLPQEELSISRGLVRVDGRPLVEDYILEPSEEDHGPVYVPRGRLFVLGDNRNHSQDSAHAHIGAVPLDAVLGKAFAVYWPPASARVCRDPAYSEPAEAARVSLHGEARAPGAL